MSRLNPTHPGETIREDCIEALGLTIAEAAEHLQVEEEALAAICECHAPITADIAVRLEQAFGSTADHWLRMQAAHDLAQAREMACGIKRIQREVVSTFTSPSQLIFVRQLSDDPERNNEHDGNYHTNEGSQPGTRSAPAHVPKICRVKPTVTVGRPNRPSLDHVRLSLVSPSMLLPSTNRDPLRGWTRGPARRSATPIMSRNKPIVNNMPSTMPLPTPLVRRPYYSLFSHETPGSQHR